MAGPTCDETSPLPHSRVDCDSIDVRELDAARALLMGPYFVSNGKESTKTDAPEEEDEVFESNALVAQSSEVGSSCSDDDDLNAGPEVQRRRPRSASETLDYLAALAERERCAVDMISTTSTTVSDSSHSSNTSSSSSAASSDDDSEAMPPPPPRGRPRSVSNPEGMDRWNLLGTASCYQVSDYSRRHLVLPASILEEELKEARVAIRGFRAGSPPSIPEDAEYLDDSSLPTSPDDDNDEYEGEVDYESERLSPEELLHRARSRLLEDLSVSSVSGDKGILILPHALAKYKELYNKNGRIGIYTPQERAAIIARYHEKRSNRNWNKKIRYNCRKNLADRRLRVKGRFVKRGPESTQTDKKPIELLDDEDDEEENETHQIDEHMPDVNDPEAGFAPTADQPYRRLRRSTVT